MANLGKSDLISGAIKHSSLYKEQLEEALKAFTTVIEKELKNGNNIQLRGFGTFSILHKKETVRNQFAAKGVVGRVTVPAHNVVKFKPHFTLQD